VPCAAYHKAGKQRGARDIRDPREIERDGKIPGILLYPGMLEFSDRPRKALMPNLFQGDKNSSFIAPGPAFGAGAKTAQDGLKPVAHLGAGGASRGPVESGAEEGRRKAGHHAHARLSRASTSGA